MALAEISAWGRSSLPDSSARAASPLTRPHERNCFPAEPLEQQASTTSAAVGAASTQSYWGCDDVPTASSLRLGKDDAFSSARNGVAVVCFDSRDECPGPRGEI